MQPPSGAPNGGRKRRKWEVPETINLGDSALFPKLLEKNKEKEEIIRITSLVEGRPMMTLNQFIVKREITRITKNWSKIGRSKEGDIILKIKGEKDIETMKKLNRIGQWSVKVTKDDYLNTVKGVVYCRDLIYLTDEEIIEAFNGWCDETKKRILE